MFIVTQSEMGGAQKFIYNLIHYLDKDKYELLVAAGSDGKGELLRLLNAENIPTKELKFFKRDTGIFWGVFNNLKAMFEIRGLIKSFRPEVLFLNSSKAGFSGSMAALLCRNRKNIKVIYRIGGWTFNDPWPAWKKKLWILMEKVSARWKEIIIVNNRHDFEQAKHLKIRPKKQLILIHNGLDVYKMDFLPREEARLKLFEKIARQSGKIFQADKIIGAIANFYPPKGLKYLIEAAEYFKNKDEVVFVVIGDGRERNELEDLIEQKGLRKKVFLLGQIPDAQKLLNAFDIFILPSVKEGFPWVVIEAMAAKLPVIATKVGAIPEIIEEGKNGFIVEPAHPEKIAERIQDLLNNDRLCQEFGIQAHQTILFKFPLEKMLKKIESIL